jgi:AraC family transcriptional activator of pobA
VRLGSRQPDGTPVYSYLRLPGVPPINVLRFHRAGGGPAHQAHAHDFLVLAYFERDGGSVRTRTQGWRIQAGDVYVLAPGEVIEPDVFGEHGSAAAHGWAAFFPPDVLEPQTPGAFLSWRSHPLLFPFVDGLTDGSGGVQRLRVRPADRAAWSADFAALDRELRERRDGYNEAALAYLRLLLVATSRLAADVPGDLARRDEPLLATVFGVIESRYREPISLQDVAAAAGLTPGHLTTVVGRKTGRTVQQWITERRMVEARRLLADTDLTVEAVATRVGYRDAGYFIRMFRRAHDTTPLDWRRSGRRPEPLRPRAS